MASASLRALHLGQRTTPTTSSMAWSAGASCVIATSLMMPRNRCRSSLARAGSTPSFPMRQVPFRSTSRSSPHAGHDVYRWPRTTIRRMTKRPQSGRIGSRQIAAASSFCMLVSPVPGARPATSAASLRTGLAEGSCLPSSLPISTSPISAHACMSSSGRLPRLNSTTHGRTSRTAGLRSEPSTISRLSTAQSSATASAFAQSFDF